MSSIIQVFEYGKLYVGDKNFKAHHFDALVAYNDKHNDRFFTVGNKKITFSSYVGVIQVSDLTIEILPKGDKYIDSEERRNKWRFALINLLSECNKIKLKSTQSAFLSSHRHSLLDFYISYFLSEVEGILRQGFLRMYNQRSGQKYSLKGALHFPKHIATNYIHKERFYTRHQVFDYNHQFNQILKSALNVLLNMNLNSSLLGKAKNLELKMEGVDTIHPSKVNASRIHFDRRLSLYRDAIQIGLMILNEYSPVLKTGEKDILAFLFNMNELFEEFIYRRLLREVGNFKEIDLKVMDQVRKEFWSDKTVRPDILLTFNDGDKKKSVVLDTKWKLLDEPIPSDSDLKQMFVYNLYFSTDRSILVYPFNGFEDKPNTSYHYAKWVQHDSHGCEMKFINPFLGDGRINESFAKNLIQQIIKN